MNEEQWQTVTTEKSIYSFLSAMVLNSKLFTIADVAEERELDGFLHPDHAYMANSRRGSSQSEQLDVEPYQLNKDFSISLPGSRRSSFQSIQNNDKGNTLTLIHKYYYYSSSSIQNISTQVRFDGKTIFSS